MKRSQCPKPLFIVFVLLIAFSTTSAAASDDTYQNVLIEHLEMGPATYLKIEAQGKTAADIDKRLTELYYGNDLQPFWIKDGVPGPRAADTLAVLDDAGSHGLDPADYFTDRPKPRSIAPNCLSRAPW